LNTLDVVIVKDSDLMLPVKLPYHCGSFQHPDKKQSSLQQVHHGSSKQLSLRASLLSGYSLMAPTETMAFLPLENPRIKMRECQQKDNCVWFAVYDDDLRQDVFAGKISHCVDTQLPSEFCSWRLGDYEPFLINSNAVCVRKMSEVDRLFEGQQTVTLVRLYLVKLAQMFDIVRMKNY